MRKLLKQEVLDLLLGAAIVGTGGGGSLEKGVRLIEEAFEDSREFWMADVDEIPDDALIASPYSCGSIGTLSQRERELYDALPKIDTTQEIQSLRVLEKYYQKPFYGIFATELGGGNTAVALHAAAYLGKPIIDADPAGRSVPCLQHSTLFLNNISISPMGIANIFGDELIVLNSANDDRAEAIARAMAVASYNSVGVTDHPAEWKLLKNSLIKNTLSYCLNIGKIAQKARDEGRIFAGDIIENFGGYLLFEGIVDEAFWEDRDGFTFGDIVIKGLGSYQNEKMRIWFQNENIISWKNEKTFITVPDCINIVRHDTNLPLLNPHAEKGMEVTVFALKAFEEWRTPKALEIFSPNFFGYDIEYRPVEEFF